jgi:hypothetical protein
MVEIQAEGRYVCQLGAGAGGWLEAPLFNVIPLRGTTGALVARVTASDPKKSVTRMSRGLLSMSFSLHSVSTPSSGGWLTKRACLLLCKVESGFDALYSVECHA